MEIIKKKNTGTSENKMGVMPENKLLLSMSVPIMISMLVQALYNIVDSIFVAQLNENALTAVSLAFPVQNLMIAVSIGTGIGMNAYLSKSLGEKNFGDVSKTATNGVFLTWLSCAVFILIGIFGSETFYRSQTDIGQIINYGRDYMAIVCVGSVALFSQIVFERLLASTGKTIYSMISQGAGAITNIILDPIMIFGLFGFPRMETAGAALATVVGQTVAALLALIFNLKFNREIKLTAKNFRPSWRIIKRIYQVGLPSILMQSVGSVMTYGFNRILIAFTPTATAVFGVYFKLQSFIFMPVYGLNNGMVPIIAYNFGAQKKDRIIKTIQLSAAYAVSIMLIGTALFLLLPGKLLLMFNATEHMLAIGIPALRIISIHFVLAGFCIIFISAFQALGNGMMSLIISILRQLVVLLPVAWLLSKTVNISVGIDGNIVGKIDAIWWSFPIAEIAALIMSSLFMRDVYRKQIKTL